MEKFNQIITAVLSSKISIVIYILMFIYLVIIPLLAFIPGLEWLMPTTPAMLIGDNYTSVLAALGASIASVAGVKAHQAIKDYHKKHAELQKSVNDLHAKIDRLSNQ